MKKTYMTPLVEVYEIEIESMVCTSITVADNPLSGKEDGFELAAKDLVSILDDISPSFDWNKNF